MPEEDDLESLLRKLESELGQVQEQLAVTRSRGARAGDGGPVRRSTLRLGAVQAPVAPESSERLTPIGAREAGHDEGDRDVPAAPARPESAGRYVIVGEPLRRRRTP